MYSNENHFYPDNMALDQYQSVGEPSSILIRNLVIILICVLITVYLTIKIMHPFWSSQPVMHSYDFWRYNASVPSIIQVKPLYYKKYMDFEKIKTVPFLDMATEEILKVVDLLQANYYDEENSMFMFHKKNADTLFSGRSRPTYISMYEPGQEIQGCISSRYVKLYLTNSIKRVSYEYGAYYTDFLCSKREFNGDTKRSAIMRKIWATHDYNLRTAEPDAPIAIFHRETNLADGVIPILSYTKYVYSMDGKKDGKVAYPPKTVLTEITHQNISILVDYKLYARFRLCALAEIPALSEMLKMRLLRIYVVNKDADIYAVYIFRDSRTQYEWSSAGSAKEHSGAVLELVGSCKSTRADAVFYTGFLDALEKIYNDTNGIFTYLSMGDYSWNNILLDFIPWTPLSKTHCAYYTMNFIVPIGTARPVDTLFVC